MIGRPTDLDVIALIGLASDCLAPSGDRERNAGNQYAHDEHCNCDRQQLARTSRTHRIRRVAGGEVTQAARGRLDREWLTLVAANGYPRPVYVIRPVDKA